MRLLVSWLREFVDVPASPEEIAGTLGLRGFEVASIEPLERRRRGDRFRDHRQPARLPERARTRAGGRYRVRSPRSRCRRPTLARRSHLRQVADWRIGSRQGDDRGRGPVPALRGRRRRRDHRAVARVAGDAARSGWRPPDQQSGRHHQLRAARARPSDARLRPRAPRRRRAAHPHGETGRDAAGRSTTSSASSTPTCSSSQTRIARRRSPASWAARHPRCRARRRLSRSRARTSSRRPSGRPASGWVSRPRRRRGSSAARDINAPVVALERALALMEQIGAGRVVGSDRRHVSAAARCRTRCICACEAPRAAARRRGRSSRRRTHSPQPRVSA